MEEMDQVAQESFSPREYKRFQKVSEEDKSRAFYNCWTRKEAFVKAIGEGPTFPLHQFEVSFEPDATAELLTVHASREEAKR